MAQVNEATITPSKIPTSPTAATISSPPTQTPPVMTTVSTTTYPILDTPTDDDSLKLSSLVRDMRVQMPEAWVDIDPKTEEEVMFGLTTAFGRVDTSQFVKKKMGLSYMSWAKAWEMVLDVAPDAHYDFCTFNGDMFRTINGTAMVFSIITIRGVSRFMWLPVMNASNKCIPIKDITAMDINRSWMRCLVKNIAMFKLGLNVYNGEDLPSDIAEERKELQAKITQVTKLGQQKVKMDKDAVMRVMSELNDGDPNPANIKSIDVCEKIIEELKKIGKTEKTNKDNKKEVKE